MIPNIIAACMIYALVASALFATTTVIYPKQLQGDTRDLYKIELLKRALLSSEDKYGPFELKTSDIVMNEKRMDALMREGDGAYLNIIFKATTKDREENLTPVKIPILKGLLGYRVFLINKTTQPQFDRIKTLDDLKKLTVGQGLGWRDTDVFTANGINVLTSSDYEGLFEMTANKRFDYFSRGITEAPHEYAERKKKLPSLKIEDTILLYYPWPVYFFTMKTTAGKALAERLEYGLQTMIKNGEFDRLFNAYYQNTFKTLHLKDRKLFELDNPALPDDTPLDVKSYWMTLDAIQ